MPVPVETQQLAYSGSSWTVVLDDFAFCGGDGLVNGVNPCEAISVCGACLLAPPDGLGIPELVTSDTSYASKDGVKHHADWYGARLVTLQVAVSQGSCECIETRRTVSEIMLRWRRMCEGDKELVIWPPCPPDPMGPITGPDRTFYGPYGVVGRGRLAQLRWLQDGSALITLRFDGVDQKLNLLDFCGTPGSGGGSVTLLSTSSAFCRSYPRCYPMCYPTDISEPAAGPQTATVDGTECVCPTIVLDGRLTSPKIENQTTGETLTYNGTILGDNPVTIDVCAGTATLEDGTVVTTSLSGGLTLLQGDNVLRMTSFGSSDTGNAVISWRPFVVSA